MIWKPWVLWKPPWKKINNKKLMQVKMTKLPKKLTLEPLLLKQDLQKNLSIEKLKRKMYAAAAYANAQERKLDIYHALDASQLNAVLLLLELSPYSLFSLLSLKFSISSLVTLSIGGMYS